MMFGVEDMKTNANHMIKHRDMDRAGMVHKAINQMPMENLRLLGHRANIMLPRGADSRHRMQGRVEQVRHHKANARIIVDRALG